MQPFLKQIALYIHENFSEKPDDLCIVLPSKRGALFLKHHLARAFNKTIWLPTVISAEDLIAELSGLQGIEDVDLVCRLYESYKEVYGEKAEPFDSFVKWGHLIIQDFNEIDRYLADGKALYSNLHEIKEIENWSLSKEELSEFQKNYLDFMRHLGKIYIHFREALLKNNESYQGLAYREAVLKFETNPFINKFSKILLCGFNALNTAETHIFSKLCTSGRAIMLWDADTYYLENNFMEAGLFLRRNFKTFAAKEQLFIGNHFKEEKAIEIISVPKQIGQAQTVHNILKSWLAQGIAPDSIAIVLANEKLLWPVLKTLPDEVEFVNITMEYPVKYTSAYNCIDLFLKFQLAFTTQNRKQKHIYYRDFLNILRHPYFHEFLEALGLSRISDNLTGRILERNYAFITHDLLRELYGEHYPKISELFEPWENSTRAVEQIGKLLNVVKQKHLSGELNNYKTLELEYLHVLIKNFNRVAEFVGKYSYFESLRSFKILFNQIVGASSAAFIGEPLRGIQIMGVLETRTLDFENVIFVSVNEGVLPSGKTQSSFIPNDLKRFFGLPLYADKDAIYSYHFYRMIQRAKNVFITYDSETDAFGKGEKSRFVSQLQFELPLYNKTIKLKESIALNGGFTQEDIKEISVEKTQEALQKILDKSLKDEDYFGLSPSSLITFKNCALKFYFRYGIGLKEPEVLEESAEANTFGSILHGSLESLYKPFIGKNVGAGDISAMKKQTPVAVEDSFLNYFSRTEAFFGKNLLQQQVLKVYVDKLLDLDRDFISFLEKQKKQLNILHLEKEMSAPLKIKLQGEETEVFIKGKADRIDRFDDTVRIVDYKSSVHTSDKFVFAGFGVLFTDKNYDKMLQLFLYAWLACKNKMALPEQIKPCIIPFKKFEDEPKYILFNNETLDFTSDLLNDFESHLVRFIESIYDKNAGFSQTIDTDTCEYCAYKVICNR